MLEDTYIQSRLEEGVSAWHLHCALFYLKKSNHSIPEVELNSRVIYFWSQKILHMKKENLFPAPFIDVFSFVMCLSFCRLIWLFSIFLFNICFSCLFSSVKINVIENPTLKIQFAALLALYVCLPRCMLEGCTYSTKVQSTVSSFST